MIFLLKGLQGPALKAWAVPLTTSHSAVWQQIRNKMFCCVIALHRSCEIWLLLITVITPLFSESARSQQLGQVEAGWQPWCHRQIQTGNKESDNGAVALQIRLLNGVYVWCFITIVLIMYHYESKGVTLADCVFHYPCPLTWVRCQCFTLLEGAFQLWDIVLGLKPVPGLVVMVNA